MAVLIKQFTRRPASGLLFRMLLAGTFSSAAVVNRRPIIGILTEKVAEKDESFIVASYVKFLECAGARVMPILSHSSEEDLTSAFESINGVLFPGGGVSFDKSFYGTAGDVIFGLAKRANDRGDYFPLWGTCLGFELLNYLQGGNDYSILSDVDAENLPLNLNFTKAASTSRMYSNFSSDLMKWLSEEELTFNNHRSGITMETFNSTPKLNQFYRVLSTNKDRGGTEFISSIEAIDYPFYGVQWHPEKSGFEWNTKEDINHSQHAVIAMQMAANFFVSEARQSSHHFSSLEEERASLIYAHTPTYTGDSSDYEQKYYFH